MTCAFCELETRSSTRLAALDVCRGCAADPESAIRERGTAIEWSTSMGVFSASASLQHLVDVGFTCGPQGLHHKAIKLFVDEVEVGDATFDDRVYVRTSHRAFTSAFLAGEGAQSVILVFLVGMRNDRFISSHVTLADGVLTARAIPMDGVPEAMALDLRQHFSALVVWLLGQQA